MAEIARQLISVQAAAEARIAKEIAPIREELRDQSEKLEETELWKRSLYRNGKRDGGAPGFIETFVEGVNRKFDLLFAKVDASALAVSLQHGAEDGITRSDRRRHDDWTRWTAIIALGVSIALGIASLMKH
jgi:hypothetical protein